MIPGLLPGSAPRVSLSPESLAHEKEGVISTEDGGKEAV